MSLSVLLLVLALNPNETGVVLDVASMGNVQIVDSQGSYCAEVAAYYTLQNIPFQEICDKMKEKLGESPYSLQALSEFLEANGRQNKIVRLKNKGDLYSGAIKRGILYFPPTGNNKIGHFSYVECREGRKVVILDPIFDSQKPIPVTESQKMMGNWDGVVLIIDQ